MKYERKMYYRCHPSCSYRAFFKGKGMKCTNDDSYADKLTEEYIVCPISRDYYEHMDVFYTVLRTERGFVGLNIISGEPFMVEPALDLYIKWLRKRRRSVSIWKAPINMENLNSDVIVTDEIYAEFILGWDVAMEIKKYAKSVYPIFEATLPSDLRTLSENLIALRKAYKKMRLSRESTNDELAKFGLSVIDAESKLIEESYFAYYRDHRITRLDFLRVRNRFRGWE